jgi:acetate kinase
VTETVLVVNAGSSSIKFQLFSVAAGDQLERRLKGQIEGVGVKPHLIARRFMATAIWDMFLPMARRIGVA